MSYFALCFSDVVPNLEFLRSYGYLFIVFIITLISVNISLLAFTLLLMLKRAIVNYLAKRKAKKEAK